MLMNGCDGDELAGYNFCESHFYRMAAAASKWMSWQVR
jgi:hypothetical protein